MARAWPFEAKAEIERFKTPQAFVESRGTQGTEAVIVRIGLNDAQLILIDGEGRWDRWVYHSVDEAKAASESLGVDVHEGEYPEKTRVRINGHQRPAHDFNRGAYPEQGAVGPVIPYPENRPREMQQRHLEAQKKTDETPAE